MSMHTGIAYYRDTRYLPDAEPMFAIVGRDTPLPRGAEFRLDGDHWTELQGMPVMGWLLDGDPFLDLTPEAEMPLLLTPETAQLIPA